MKIALRFIAFMIVYTLCFMMCTCPVIGENYVWDCPECGRIGNTGNYCGGCAHPAPWLEDQ